MRNIMQVSDLQIKMIQSTVSDIGTNLYIYGLIGEELNGVTPGNESWLTAEEAETLGFANKVEESKNAVAHSCDASGNKGITTERFERVVAYFEKSSNISVS